jgi:hypothetical protein
MKEVKDFANWRFKSSSIGICKHGNEDYCGYCGFLNQETWYRHLAYIWDHTWVGPDYDGKPANNPFRINGER